MSTDLKSSDGVGSLSKDEDASETLLKSTDKANYKGGAGADILHIPLTYEDSYIVSPEINQQVDEYIKLSEYAMSLAITLAGILCLLLEKHNFSKFEDEYKIPIYMLMGASMAFVVVYTVFDLVEVVNTSIHYYVM